MNTRLAHELLGLLAVEAQSVRSIRAAWAARCRAFHPDTAGNMSVHQGDALNELTSARDFLLLALEKQNRTCKLCGGVGKVRATVGMRDCVACSGTGEKV
jgi:DnaJ-class molecular chaperone